MNREFLKRGDLIPLSGRLPGEGEPGQCAEYLLDILESDEGIVGVDFDTGSARLSVQYDAAVLPAHRADQIAEDIGERLASHRGMCIIRDSAGGCQACAATLQHGLLRSGRTLAEVMIGPGQLALAAGPVLQPAEVTRPVGRSNETVKTERFWQRWDRNRVQIVLTALTAALILAGWIGSALGMPADVSDALFITAYITGGWFGVQAGMEDLRRRVVNVDLLMVLAALGAGAIGQWREGAILLFLFSLSNTLQTYAMDRSRQAIKALMQLRPDEALVRRSRTEVRIRVERVVVGDRVIVKPGERIPIDGTVAVGESAVDQSTITGESMPVDVTARFSNLRGDAQYARRPGD